MLHFTKSRAILPLALIAAVAVTCLQGAAFAKAPMVPTHRTISIPVNGLDLARTADVASLDLRIRAAAHSVCKPEDFRNIRGLSDRSACKAKAIAEATGQRDLLVAQAQDRAVRMAANREAAPSTN